jgi:hypothetical protein
MTKDEALRMALETLECLKKDFDADQFEWEIADVAITAIKEALAQPEQGEPPQRTWQGLTDEDIENAYIRTEHFVDMAKVLDDILKEKNT